MPRQLVERVAQRLMLDIQRNDLRGMRLRGVARQRDLPDRDDPGDPRAPGDAFIGRSPSSGRLL